MNFDTGTPVDIHKKDVFLDLYVDAIDEGYAGFFISAASSFGEDYRVHFIPNNISPKKFSRNIHRNRCIHYFYDVNVHFDKQTGIWGEDDDGRPVIVVTANDSKNDMKDIYFSDSICGKVHSGLRYKTKGNALIILAKSLLPASALVLDDLEIKELEEIAHWA